MAGFTEPTATAAGLCVTWGRRAGGKCVSRKTLFTGFREGNQQHRLNGFDYGLDGWVYGANGDSGGIVRYVGAEGRGKMRLAQNAFHRFSRGQPAASAERIRLRPRWLGLRSQRRQRRDCALRGGGGQGENASRAKRFSPVFARATSSIG